MKKIIHLFLLMALSLLFISCKGGSPKVVSDLKFGEPFEEMIKKFGDFEVDKRTCNTPPNCDFYYGQRKKIDNCLWHGINTKADFNSGKVTWVNIAFAGKCNGINDNPLVKEHFSKDDPAPTYLYHDRAYGHNFDAGKDNTWAIWESGDAFVTVTADCYNSPKKKYETNFLDCRLRKIDVATEGKTNKDFQVNNFKFYE